jgi:hypothetical protein
VRIISSADAVTAAVTFGLPSRSPPIHDPNVISGGTAIASPG